MGRCNNRKATNKFTATGGGADQEVLGLIHTDEPSICQFNQGIASTYVK